MPVKDWKKDFIARRKKQLGNGRWGQPVKYDPKQWYQKSYYAKQDYTPPMDQEQTVKAMPNYDKLTPMERWLYRRLPGFAETTVGKALERFGGGWAGKALSYLDIPAEGVERTVGVLAQIQYDQQESDPRYATGEVTPTSINTWEDLKNAWYAGGLAADVLNLPSLKYDDDGKVVGIHIPTDLPGQAALVTARQKIAEGTPLEQVRSEMYNDLGALQLRSQLYDTYWHVIADPLNVIMPMLKPVERANLARRGIMASGRLSKLGIEGLQELEEAARAAGKLDEAAIIAKKVANADLLTTTDRFIMALTGGDPLAMPTTKLGKLWRTRFNPFSLTPEARAFELLTMVNDHVGNYILAEIDDPIKIVEAINRGLRGALGDEFGHAFINIEGRTVQGALGGFDAKAQDLLKAWINTTDDRVLLQDLAKMLDEHPDKLLADIIEASAKGKENELAALASRLGMNDADGLKVLKDLGAKFEDIPHSEALFKLYLSNSIADHVAHQGVIQFGVASRGLMNKVSTALKSAETMAFLRINPAYAVRNIVNNEFTMVARGLVGRMTGRSIDDLWGRIGFKPIRLEQGVGAIGFEVGQATKAGKFAEMGAAEVGGKAIYETLRGERGALDRFADFINGLDVTKKGDFATFSARMEKNASKRAMTIGYLEGMKYYWKPGRGYDFARDFVNSDVYDAVEAANPGVWKQFENALSRAVSPDDIEKAAHGNLNLNMKSILDDASEKAGFKVEDILSPEYIAKHEEGLLKAAEEGPNAIWEYVARMKRDIQENMDEFLQPRVLQKASETAAKIEAEGLGAVMPIFADELDGFWFAHQVYANRMRDVQDEIGRGLSMQAEHQQWLSIKAEHSKFWERRFAEFEGTLKGMRQGAERKGFNIPDEIEQSFKWVRQEYEGFFKRRDALQNTYFEAKLNGETPPMKWSEILDQMDDEYKRLIEVEDALQSHIDEVTANALPDEAMREPFKAWRSKARQLRREDRELVMQFRESIRDISDPARREAKYKEFWMQRREKWEQLWRNDRMGLSAMSGNADAQAVLDDAVNTIKEYDEVPNVLKRWQDTGKLEDDEFELIQRLAQEGTPEQRLRLGQIEEELTAPAFMSAEEEAARRTPLFEEYGRLLDDVKGKLQGRTAAPGFDTFWDEAMAVSDDPVIQARKLASLYGVPSAKEVGGDKRIVDAVNLYILNKEDVLKRGDYLIPGTPEGKRIAQLFEQHGDKVEFDALTRQFNDLTTQIQAETTDMLRKSLLETRQKETLDKLESMAGDVIEKGQYKTLEEIPLEEIDRALAKRAAEKGLPTAPEKTIAQEVARGVKREIPAKVWERDAQKLIDEWIRTTSSETDPRVAAAMQREAGVLMDRLEASEAGYRYWDWDVPEAGKTYEVREVPSSFPQWYRDLSGSKNKKSLLIAFQKIAAGGDLDRGVMVRKLKRLIFERIGPGGVSEDARILYVLGDEKGAYNIVLRELEDEVDLLEKYGQIQGQKFYDLLQKDPNELRSFARNSAYKPGATEGVIDSGKFLPNEAPIHKGQDEFWLQRGFKSIDAMAESVEDAARKPPLRWDNLNPEQTAEFEKYIAHAKGQFADARFASTRFAEFRRDAALLNYNRRYHYNTWLGTLAPYEFWTTHSMAKWALHSIDRPAMLSTYLRIKKLLETAGAPNQALPSRLKGAIRMALPFLPDWMGKNLFIDPMRVALPIDQFMFGYEERQNKQMTLEGRTSRLIEEAVDNGELDANDGAIAIEGMEGSTWEKYKAIALENDKELKFDAMDFVTLMTPPHAPILWAREIARGTPENISPFTPMSRTLKGVAGLMGVDWTSHPLNLEAKLRKSLGLPAFDKWEDYRVERMLSNMAANGQADPYLAYRAVIEHDQTGEWNELGQEAVELANKEFGVMALGGTLGLPMKTYPVGEMKARSLKDDFNRAYTAWANGDVQALTSFFDEHPEYENRLALWKTPEVRFRRFIVDEIWNKYMGMNSLNKKEVRNQLGQNFETQFLDEDTASIDSIPMETLTVWLKLMGGDPPGTLQASVGDIEFAPPDIAYRAQVFYNQRKELFPNWYEEQSTYYELAKGKARAAYARKTRSLTDYWDWRNDWLHRNPTVTPYLDDDYEFRYPSEGQRTAAYANEPNFTWEEWQGVLSPSMQNMVKYAANGNELPDAGRNQLEEIAEQMGVDPDFLLDNMILSSPFKPLPEVSPYTEMGGGGGEGQTGEIPYDFKEDDRLTDETKKLLERHVMDFNENQISGIYNKTNMAAGVAFDLPLALQHNEFAGFKRFGISAKEGKRDEYVWLHEVGHAIQRIQYSEGNETSANPEFIRDLETWAKEKDPPGWKVSVDQAREWWADTFAKAVMHPRTIPDYMKRWYRPYVKGL